MKGEKAKSAVGMGRHLSMLAAWGLSIDRKLAKAMGGEMKVSSVLGKGTTFAIVVPGVEVAGEELRIENGKCKMKEENSAILHSTFSTLHSSSRRLLIADDTKMNQIVFNLEALKSLMS